MRIKINVKNVQLKITTITRKRVTTHKLITRVLRRTNEKLDQIRSSDFFFQMIFKIVEQHFIPGTGEGIYKFSGLGISADKASNFIVGRSVPLKRTWLRAKLRNRRSKTFFADCRIFRAHFSDILHDNVSSVFGECLLHIKENREQIHKKDICVSVYYCWR